MSNISHGAAGFSDPRMAGHPQRDAREERSSAWDQEEPGRTDGQGRKAAARGDEATAQQRAQDFRARMESARHRHDPVRLEEPDPDHQMPGVQLASARMEAPAGASPTASPPAPLHLMAQVEQIHRILGQQLRAEALSARAVSVHLRLPPLADGGALSVDLRLDAAGLDVVFAHDATDLPEALALAAADLAQSLAIRLPSRQIRIFSRGAGAVRAEPAGDGLAALSEIFGAGGGRS